MEYFKKKARTNVKTTGFFYHTIMILSLVLLIPEENNAQSKGVVRSIIFHGVAAINEDELLQMMQTKQGSMFFRSDSQTIVSWYTSLGYLNARIDSFREQYSSDSTRLDLVYYITEGKPSRVDTIKIEENRAFSSELLLSQMKTKEHTIFSSRQLESDIGALLAFYEHRGYPLTKITITRMELRESSEVIQVSLSLLINEGVRLQISTLLVKGNELTSSEVIQREARLSGTEPYSHDLAVKIKKRIERLQLFNSVSLPELVLKEDGHAALMVNVQEGRQNRFDGIVGYIPSTTSESAGYLTGLLDLQFRNIMGSARRFDARWFRESPVTQEIQLHYGEPWVASIPMNLDLRFQQRKQDSTYTRRQIALDAELFLADELSGGMSISQTTVIPSELYGFRFMQNSTTTMIGVTFRYDSRDNVIIPEEGSYYRASYGTGKKSIESHSTLTEQLSSTTQRFDLDLEWYFSPVRRQVAALALFVREFRSGTPELSDLFRIGGATTIRGYREGQFLASRMVWSNLEYRVIFGERAFAYLFMDAGYLSCPEIVLAGVERQEQLKYGYGVGLRTDSPLGIIGVSIGLGEGDTFSMAKLHVRLVNEF
ncbi:MAG: POTRA domain-containing protein [bacterium]